MLLEVCCLALDLSRAATLTLLLPQREVEPEGVSVMRRPAVCRVAPTSSAGNKNLTLCSSEVACYNMQTHGNAFNAWKCAHSHTCGMQTH